MDEWHLSRCSQETMKGKCVHKKHCYRMWVCDFWQALEVQHDALQQMQLHVDRCRSRAFANLSCDYEGCSKCNFVLIDVEVGLLLTFLASMKAKVHLYKKYVSVLGCLHVKSQPFFKHPFSRSPLTPPDSKVSVLSMCFHRLCVNRRPKW